MNFLDQIIENKKLEVNALKSRYTFKDFMEQDLFQRETISFSKAISSDFGIIAEFKRKSPSAGNLLVETAISEQLKNYEENGASALSILTDSKYFGGSIEDISMNRTRTNLPILRKEFIVDEIQLFESKACGADAVLLIASVLDKNLAHHLTILAKSLGLEVVFEVHTVDDLSKINDEIDCILVNNRDLKKQLCDLNTSAYFAEILPKNVCSISASGIKTRDEIDYIKTLGYSAALIGESIIRQNHLIQLTQKSIVA
ncbi:MAG: indole-3-glycerol phosphate synthase TrpC [Fluviicola sp.]|jgi:indole-3-glycerol phosphate synthase